MSGGSDRTLPADWAVLGKHQGHSMGYEMLGGSLPKVRAERYLFGAATGTPDDRDPVGALPWRVFLGTVPDESVPVCAVAEMTWDGTRDATGAASYSWSLMLLEWQQAGTAGLTWTGLDRGAARVRSPERSDDRVPFEAARADAAQLAATVEELDFGWAAGVAALLLDGRRVVITVPPGGPVPDTDRRVQILDAVCALLPYGCRAWLSGATWTGRSEHQLRLVFAPAARAGQMEVALGSGLPPEPQGDTARAYLTELWRMRQKQEPTVAMVEHLLAATTVVPVQEAAQALHLLREMDLLSSVVSDIKQGRGNLRDVVRLLHLHRMESLGEHHQAVLVSFLFRLVPGPDGGQARELLEQHWLRSTPRLLAGDVIALGATSDSFARAKSHLGVLREFEARHPGLFDELFTALVTAPGQDPVWVGELAYFVERKHAHTSAVADRIVLDRSDVGHAWLASLMEPGRDRSPLARIVASAIAADLDRWPGWLRFAAVITGRLAPDQAIEADAADFTSAHAKGTGWRVALEIAAENRQPATVGLLWPALREVPRSDHRRELSALLNAVASPDATESMPRAAADADLLDVLVRAHDSSRTIAPLPRLARLTGQEVLDGYADAVVRRIDADPVLKDLAIETLLGDAPGDARWTVLQRLMRRLRSTESTVLDGLVTRLTRDTYEPWLDLDLTDGTLRSLERRPGLDWLRPVRDVRLALRNGQSYPHWCGIVTAAYGERGFSRQLLHEVASAVERYGPLFAFYASVELEKQRTTLGIELYRALHRSGRYTALVRQMHGFSTGQVHRHQQLLAALGTPPQPSAQPTGGSSQDRPPVAGAPQPPYQQPFAPTPVPVPEGGPAVSDDQDHQGRSGWHLPSLPSMPFRKRGPQ
ncbi:hypothetical protein [Streptomyces sp. RKAG337]|uniref:hypothetical protein n=1 Tax=Streptomyces sp. RKAG337 TaxID=2893404 RepID=UPI002033E439|nr:hypothetical protein [Streptomyces sp. RKAG337]MCM2430829.1 hypothetical protein [Streptomyces sp. RKAG337]